jgi:hypothetical protein
MMRSRARSVTVGLSILALGCGPGVADADSTASDTTHAGSGQPGPGSSGEGDAEGPADGSGSTGSSATGVAETGSSSASTSTPEDRCPELPDERESESLGEVAIVATNVSDAPLWVALHETGCFDSAVVITARDGHTVDPTEPVGWTCANYDGGDGGSGLLCDDDRLVLLEPGDVTELVWTGLDFETLVLPAECPEAGESCERARLAEAGVYQVTASISATAMCGDGPCECDGRSDPCRVDDPSAMLVDPQAVSATFDFPDDAAVALDLALR